MRKCLRKGGWLEDHMWQASKKVYSASGASELEIQKVLIGLLYAPKY